MTTQQDPCLMHPAHSSWECPHNHGWTADDATAGAKVDRARGLTCCMPAPTPDARQLRGQQIADRATIVRLNGAWLVPSQSHSGAYSVTLEAGRIRCTCPDHREGGHVCKHIFAAAIVAKRERDAGTVAAPFHTSDGRYFADDGDRRAHQRTLDERAARQAARVAARIESSRSVA